MGGRGSGRTGGRPTWESTGSLVLRTTTFARAGLRLGVRGTATLTFTCDGGPFPVQVTIDTTDTTHPHIELEHDRRTTPVTPERYMVGLQTTPQPLGGIRWWFQCPRTGARSVRLFLPRGGHQFWSRHAYRLGYASQRESTMDRIWRRGSRLYAAMGRKHDWRDDPLPKPKWMRWRTYNRRNIELEALYERYDRAWLAGASRLLERLNARRD